MDSFFVNHESTQTKEGASCVNEDYVSALELYCLLKQYLFDIQRNWRTVVSVAFASHTHVKYARKFVHLSS